MESADWNVYYSLHYCKILPPPSHSVDSNYSIALMSSFMVSPTNEQENVIILGNRSNISKVQSTREFS